MVWPIQLYKNTHLMDILVGIYNKLIFYYFRLLLQPYNKYILKRKTFYIFFEAKLIFIRINFFFFETSVFITVTIYRLLSLNLYHTQ